MKSFQFRLERVLIFYRQGEMRQSMVVSRFEREILRIEAEKTVRDQQKTLLETLIRDTHQAMSQDQFRGSYAHADFLNRTIAALEHDVIATKVLLENERTLLLAMTKRRRTVEELRSRKRLIFDRELAYLEISNLDELNAHRVPAYSARLEDRS